MKKLILIPAIILAALALNSCASFLDEKPRTQLSGETLFTSLSDYQAALMGVYQGLAGRSQPTLNTLNVNVCGYTWGFWLLQQTGNDDTICSVWCQQAANNAETQQLDSYSYAPTNQFIEGAWAGMYVIINRANDLIERIEALPVYPNLSADYASIEGQARFLRAFCYYQLVSIYGALPMPTSATTSGTIKKPIPRSSVKDVYNLILSDLYRADAITPITYSDNLGVGRATKWSVDGFLARINLVLASMSRHAFENVPAGDKDLITLGKNGLNSFDWIHNGTDIDEATGAPKDENYYYTQARYWAGQVIDANPGLETMLYRNNFYPYENGPEILFDIQFGPADDINGGWMGWLNTQNAAGGATSKVNCVPALMAWDMRPGGDRNTPYFKMFPDSVAGAAGAPVYIINSDGTLDYSKFRTVADMRKEKTVGYAGNNYMNNYVNPGQCYPPTTSNTATGVANNPKSTWANITAQAIRNFNQNKYCSYGDAVTNGRSPVNVPMMRLAEMYLIYAEAEAEINGGTPNAKAYEMLNHVRRRAADPNILPDLSDANIFGGDNPLNAINTVWPLTAGAPALNLPLVRSVMGINVTPGDYATQFRLALMQERKWEFCGESMRKVDLIRSGWMKYYLDEVDYDIMNPAGRMYDPGAANTTQLQGSRHFHWDRMFLPIPQTNISPAVVQNYFSVN